MMLMDALSLFSCRIGLCFDRLGHRQAPEAVHLLSGRCGAWISPQAEPSGDVLGLGGAATPLKTQLNSSHQDLARLFLWVLREYEEVEPIILSGEKQLPPFPRGRRKGEKNKNKNKKPTKKHPHSPQWAKKMRSPSRRRRMPSWRPWTSKESSSYPLGQGWWSKKGDTPHPTSDCGVAAEPPHPTRDCGVAAEPPQRRHQGKAMPGASPAGMEGGTERNLTPLASKFPP